MGRHRAVGVGFDESGGTGREDIGVKCRRGKPAARCYRPASVPRVAVVRLHYREDTEEIPSICRLTEWWLTAPRHKKEDGRRCDLQQIRSPLARRPSSPFCSSQCTPPFRSRRQEGTESRLPSPGKPLQALHQVLDDRFRLDGLHAGTLHRVTARLALLLHTEHLDMVA